MNKYLIDFIDDELKNNSYYEHIQEFAVGKDWRRDILSPVVNEYEGVIDNFGPYRFLDAIEDYLGQLIDTNNLTEEMTLDDVIESAWQHNFFEHY